MAHLTPDEIDLLLEQALPVARVTHLETCSACAREARENLALARALATLPELTPAPGLADRVLAGLSRPAAPAVPARARQHRWLPARRRPWALAAGLAGLSLVSTTAAAVLIASWPPAVAVVATLTAQAANLLAAARETVAAQLGAIPWAETVTLLASEPLRLAAFAFLAVTTYATLLAALWNLMRPPRRGYAPSH